MAPSSSQLGIARKEKLLPTLQEIWGYSKLRIGQGPIIGTWCEGGEVLGLLPTGAGKSLCYQLPAIIERSLGRGTTLVVSPLIALMQDQVESLEARGVVAAALNSHLTPYEQDEVCAALEAGLLDLLFVSPERAAQSRFRDMLSGCDIALIAIDEAHCVSAWGHDFRPEYMRLAELREVSDAPMMALTATATPRVAEEIVRGLQLRTPQIVRGDFARPNLSFSVELESSSERRRVRLIELLDEGGFRLQSRSCGRSIVYASSRKACMRLSAELKSAGFKAGAYHAGMSKDDRIKAQGAFDSGRMQILVATSAFGMGVDYPDVRLIVHYQAPGSLEAYYQEAGRASRDGQPGRCVLFFSAGDMMLQRRLVRGQNDRTRSNEAIEGIERYAHSWECRQRMLCLHFDPNAGPQRCERCDACTQDEPEESHPSGVEALGIDAEDLCVKAVSNLRKPVGKKALARSLRGSRAKALRKYGLDRLPEHGALKAHSEEEICATLEALLRSGRLVRKGQKYPTLWLPNKPVRRGRIELSESAGEEQKTGGIGDKRRPRGTRAPKARAKTRVRGSNLERALELYRNRTAKRLSWKPYMVLHKKVIAQLDTERPRSLSALEDIDGLGPAKIERFGYDLLDIIRRYDQ